MNLRSTVLANLLICFVSLTGCDQVANRLGLEDPGQKDVKADAEGKAVGSACRQSGRAIEDCYSIYGWLPKASIFAGWRDMNDYMQANRLEIVEPKLPPPGGPGQKKKKVASETTDEEKKAEASAASPADGKGGAKTEVKKEAEKPPAKPAAKH